MSKKPLLPSLPKNQIIKMTIVPKKSPFARGFQRRAVLAFMLGALLFGPGCSAPAKEKKLVRDGLTLQYKSKSAVPKGVQGMSLDHPVRISAEQVRIQLLSLRYEMLSIFSKKRRIFSKKDADKVTHLIAKALNRASPNKVISYKIKTSKGNTEGDVFFSDNKINWRFQTIRGVVFSTDNATNARSASSTFWRLVPRKGQRLHSTKNLIGSKTWENWIVADPNLPPIPTKGSIRKGQNPKRKKPRKKGFVIPYRLPPEDVPQKEFTDGSPELVKKLQFLKHLRENDLIDDKEYQRKRKELLDRFL